jgi:hypothetical protein
MEDGSDAVGADDREASAAGGELRVVKRSLNKALAMSAEQKAIFLDRVEELVRGVSRVMHHGSQIATAYVLREMENDRPPTDETLQNQTFWRQCMSYAKASTPAGAYQAIKEFADERRHLFPDTKLVKMDGNCINAAARKFRASVLTMLSDRFYQRVVAATKAMFPDAPRYVLNSVASRCMGRSGGSAAVLDSRAWRFIEAVREDIFRGADVSALAVEDVVWMGGWVKRGHRDEAVAELLAGRVPSADHMTKKGLKAAEHVLAFLPDCRAAAGPVPDDAIASLVAARLPQRVSGAAREAVVNDVLRGSNEAPKDYTDLVRIARSMLRFAGAISVPWLKRHPSRALVAVRRMMLEVERGIDIAEMEGKPRRPRRFPLLPVFAQRRQMISLDALTILSICKNASILKKGTKATALTVDVRRSLFRVPKGFPFSENTSIETDGVAVVLRVFKREVTSAPKIATAADLGGVRYARVVSNDPGRRQIATTVEWTEESGLLPGSKRMTRDEYYNQAGINARMKKRRKRDEKVAGEEAVLKSATLKVATLADYEKALRARADVVEALWTHKLGRWTSISDMSGYSARRKALDRFWRHKVGLEASPSESRTVVVFGDGKFPATGRRERAVPRKAMEASAARFAAAVVKVREAYTTKVCSSCHCPTREVRMLRRVKSRAGGRRIRRVEVLELRRCESNACSASPLKSRDVDAAISILQVFLAGNERPLGYTKAGYDAAMSLRAAR